MGMCNFFSLKNKFSNTDYILISNNKRIVFRIDTLNKKINNFIIRTYGISWFFITAYNPQAMKNSYIKNYKNHNRLLYLLKKK